MQERTHLVVQPLVLSLATSLLVSLGALNPARDAESPPEVLPPTTPAAELAATPRRLLRPSEIVLPTQEGDTLAFLEIVVTGYTSCPRETDSTPFLTASMTTVRPGCLALSRDLLRTFTPDAPFDFGDWVVLPGVGLFVVEDTMNARWRKRADIWFPSKRLAKRWGRRRALIGLLPQPPATGSELFALGPRENTIG